jgi:hypothetical protein
MPLTGGAKDTSDAMQSLTGQHVDLGQNLTAGEAVNNGDDALGPAALREYAK